MQWNDGDVERKVTRRLHCCAKNPTISIPTTHYYQCQSWSQRNRISVLHKLLVVVAVTALVITDTEALPRHNAAFLLPQPKARMGEIVFRRVANDEVLWLNLRGGDIAAAQVDESQPDLNAGENIASSSSKDSEDENDDGFTVNQEEGGEANVVNSSASPRVKAKGMPAVVETTVVQHLEQSSSSDNNNVAEEDSADDKGGEESSSDDEGRTTTVPAEKSELTEAEVRTAIGIAGDMRVEGKKLHDEGRFMEAAAQFASAADLLVPILYYYSSDSSAGGAVADDFATCRLHEALCLLKAEDYEEAMRACTDILDLSSGASSDLLHIAPALRARAFHRRAKAQVELGNETAALQDARSAAFLGDHKAVSLYGKLMRENSGTWAGELGGGSGGGADDLFGNAFGDSSASSSLLQSLLSKSDGSNSNANGPMGGLESMFNPSSLLSLLGAASPGAGFGAQSNTGGGGDSMGNLAKSILSSFSKRLEEESTQTQICNFLHGTSGPQIQQVASLAGFEIDASIANRLSSFCRGVTPKAIRRTLRTTKVAIYTIQLIRKLYQVVTKYRSIIILLLIIGWTKSAFLRPLPVNKKVMRLATKAAVLEADRIAAKVTDMVAAI